MSSVSGTIYMDYNFVLNAVPTVSVQKLSPHSLIQYDPEVQGPVRDSRGRCVPVPTGETDR